MNHNEQATHDYFDHLIGSSLSLPEDPTGNVVEGQYWSGDGMDDATGFSDAQMKAIYEHNQSIYADTSADVPIDVTATTESLIDLFNVKCYGSLTDTTGLTCSTQYGLSGNQRLDSPVGNAFPLQGININNGNGFQSNLKGKTATCSSSAPPLNSMSNNRREKMKEAEYNRRCIMNQRLQALQEVLPASLKGNNRESIVDNAMGHIKHLQLQLKELSANRLRGESTSAPLIYVEGHGHYYPHDQMFKESLEEVVGSLIEEDPTAAWKLLEGKGLYMMPIASVDALQGAEQTSSG